MADEVERDRPKLTMAELRVAHELCRPSLRDKKFTPPPSEDEIASRLFVGRNAVRFMVGSLCSKFGIEPPDSAELVRYLLARGWPD